MNMLCPRSIMSTKNKLLRLGLARPHATPRVEGVRARSII